MRKRIAIVTGATGGIGKEFVKQLLYKDLDEIWAVARNKEKLMALINETGNKVHMVQLDLSDFNELKKFEELVNTENPDIKYLVNNAGIAKMGSYKDFSIDEINNTVNLNCKTPVILNKICIDYMTKGSRIINISSAASFQPNPYINLYAASKVFERSYSRALNVELCDTGITSTAVCPSWVDTEMLTHEKNGKEIKFPGIVKASSVVKRALRDADKGKDMSVCSLYVKIQHLNVKLMPQKLVMKIWTNKIKDFI